MGDEKHQFVVMVMVPPHGYCYELLNDLEDNAHDRAVCVISRQRG